jgi:hypothetical protein
MASRKIRIPIAFILFSTLIRSSGFRPDTPALSDEQNRLLKDQTGQFAKHNTYHLLDLSVLPAISKMASHGCSRRLISRKSPVMCLWSLFQSSKVSRFIEVGFYGASGVSVAAVSKMACHGCRHFTG